MLVDSLLKNATTFLRIKKVLLMTIIKNNWEEQNKEITFAHF